MAVRWLLILGANVKARDRNGTTMLHAACRQGSFLMVQELLKRELPVEAFDSAGWTWGTRNGCSLRISIYLLYILYVFTLDI